MRIESYQKEFNNLIDPRTPIEIIAEGFSFIEGPLWDHANNRLLFSDIPANTIFSWSSENGVTIYRSPSNFANGLTFDKNGHLIACEHKSRSVTLDNGSKNIVVLTEEYNGKRLNSPNDVIVAHDNSILFTDPIYGLRAGSGGPSIQELDFQGVYRLTPDRKKLFLITDSFERPNGLVLSPDEKNLYVTDTVRQHIRVFNIGENWEVKGGNIWAELWDDAYSGRPDGIKVDIHGNIYCTGPGGIWVFNKNANLIGRIYLPDKTSNLNWGDADRQSLFITSNSIVYRIRCKTKG
ncbi:MAG: SMP-30/gluconolactonase/LRE family protein [Anaerolineaceae bacterium]|nr:SMP-30/gluconolactonase/LRE family protein [Anaerolineaceae bacterium]